MKFYFGCLLLAVLLITNSYTNAQTGASSIKGKILTEKHIPADGATIALLKLTDSSVVKSTVSDKAGLFEINSIVPGLYIIQIHKIGYSKFYTRQYQLIAGKTTDVREISLIPENTQLGEVNITAKKNYIEVLPDKTVINVDKSILSAGNSVLDVLTTAPGVHVRDNSVLFKGGQKALIAINGKPVANLTDDQLADLLKSYQATNISQIELIANPSAKYDASGGGGVINIILKRSKDLGFRASIVENASYGQDYKFSTGINLNYRTEKFNFFANYSFTDNKTPRWLDIDRNIYDNNEVTNIDVNYKSTSYTKINNYNAGVDYSITPKQSIGALFYGYHNQAGIDKFSTTDIKNNGSLDSVLNTQSHIDRGITNLNYNVNYKGSFGKNDATSLTADVDYSTYNRSSFELLSNYYNLPDGIPYRDPLYYSDNSPSTINVRSERIDFSQQLTKGSSLSAGVKNNQVNSDNTIDFSQSGDATEDFLAIPSLTDHFIYKERINSAYASYNDKFDKSNFTIGLRAEQTNSFGKSYHPDKTVTRNYFDLFPNIQWIQAVDKDNQLTIGYDRRITRPNYQDLNPFVGFIGQYSYSTGNPFLKPEYFNAFAISDLYKDKYKVDLRLTITQDMFVPIYQQNDSTKIYTTTLSNIGTRYEYEVEFNLPFDITKWWDINFDLDAGYEKYIYKQDSARKSTYEVDVQLSQNFSITKGLKAELYGFYYSPTYYGIKQYQAQYSVRAGLSQSVLHDAGSIRFMVTDIFNTDEYRYTSYYANLDLAGREKVGSRFFMLTFIYRFGKASVKGPAKRVGGNADDQKRLGGSSNEN
jgi:iron complex outermembrane receptor protein